MNKASENTKGAEVRKKMVLAVLAFFTLCGFGTTLYLWSENSGLTVDTNGSRLHAERLLGEKLQLDKRIVELTNRLDMEQEARATSDHDADDLRKRVQEATARSKKREASAQRNKALVDEVAELRELKQQLEAKLAFSASGASDLVAQLTNLTADRDKLAAEFEQRKAGARMVNNAEVDALRGRKSRLTVLARRTKEVRMAFDLPQGLAQNASFRITTPNGRNYTGNDPAVSMSVDPFDAEPMASLDAVPLASPGERAARVHLKFKPQEKLEAGTYRIDVMTGGEYLNTVLLNLR